MISVRTLAGPRHPGREQPNRIFVAHFYAGPDYPVELVLHLSVAALHGIEVKLSDILALNHAGSRAAAHADSISRTPDLTISIPFFGSSFLRVEHRFDRCRR